MQIAQYKNDYENLIGKLNDKKSVMSKYLNVKSTERNLLEYLVIKNDEPKNKIYKKLSNAAEFIFSMMPAHDENQNSAFSNLQALYAVDTLKSVLKSDATKLDEIPEANIFKDYFFKKRG